VCSEICGAGILSGGGKGEDNHQSKGESGISHRGESSSRLNNLNPTPAQDGYNGTFANRAARLVVRECVRVRSGRIVLWWSAGRDVGTATIVSNA
jgi:hypothetical protein